MKFELNIRRPSWYWLVWIGTFFLEGLIAKLIWNAFIPELFGLPHLYYWQSVGLIYLLHTILPSLNLLGWFGIEIKKKK